MFPNGWSTNDERSAVQSLKSISALKSSDFGDQSISGFLLWLRPKKAKIYRAGQTFGYTFRTNLFVQTGRRHVLYLCPAKLETLGSSFQLNFSLGKRSSPPQPETQS